jgi:hypothetical protein
MADDPKKNPNQLSEQPGKQGKQDPEQRHPEQQDLPKRNPSREDKNEEQDDQQQGGQRRAS